MQRNWGALGGIAALALLSVKGAPAYAPFAWLALLGSVAVVLFKKRGLILSVLSLAVALCTLLPSWWLVLFSMALALSWSFLYFQQQTEEARQAQIVQLQQALTSEGVRGAELTEALKKNQAECWKLQGQLCADTALEPSAEEGLKLEQLEREYRHLQHRFEEKSAALNEARRDLFQAEGALHVLRGQVEEEQLHIPEEVAQLMHVVEELSAQCEADARQIESLQALTSLLVPFAKTRL